MRPFTLSQREKELVWQNLEGQIISTLPVDYNRDKGHYTDSHLVVGDKALLLISDKPEIIKEIPLESIKSFQVKREVYSAELVAVREEGEEKVCDFSIRYADVYQALTESFFQEEGFEPIDVSAYVCKSCGEELDKDRSICTTCWKPRRLLKKMAPMIAKERKWILLALLGFALTNGCFLLFPQLTRILVNDYLLAEEYKGTASLLLFIGVFALLYGINYGGTHFRERSVNRFGAGFIKSLREKLFARNISMGLKRMNTWSPGRIINILVQDTETVRAFFHNQLTNGVNQIIVLTGIFIILLFSNLPLLLILFAPLPISIAIGKILNNHFKYAYIFFRRFEDRQSIGVKEALDGVKVVKSFGREKDEHGKFSDLGEDIRSLFVTTNQNWLVFTIVFSASMKIGMVLVWLYGGLSVIRGTMNPGELVQFSAYAGMLYGPASFVSNIPQQLSQVYTALVRTWQLFDEEVESSAEIPVNEEEFRRDITIRDLSFRYKPETPLFQNLNLTIRQGEIVGIVGPSGAGKSTLTNLLLNLFPAESGEILYGESSIKDIPLEQLRNRIGIVMQQSLMIRGTVLENLTFGREGYDLSKVMEAAEIAQIHERIINLPEGYNTLIGEGGHQLSGGEMQRLSIARAILSAPPILILDEATSSLDAETEENVQLALDHFDRGGHTTIVIAHRLSTLKNADHIYFLDKGKLIEEGTHGELMEADGAYASMVRTQLAMSEHKAGEAVL